MGVDMNDRTQSVVASLFTVAAGAWLLLTPAFTSVSGAALTNMLVVGGAVALLGLVQAFWVNVLPSWLNGLAAVYAFFAAFIVDMSTTATWNLAVAAVVIFVLAIWDGFEIAHFEDRMHRQM